MPYISATADMASSTLSVGDASLLLISAGVSVVFVANGERYGIRDFEVGPQCCKAVSLQSTAACSDIVLASR